MATLVPSEMVNRVDVNTTRYHGNYRDLLGFAFISWRPGRETGPLRPRDLTL